MLEKIKKIFTGSDKEKSDIVEDEFYDVTSEDAFKELGADGNKMVLLEPKAFSESQAIADHLKSRRSVVVNFKRVTPEQAKRIVDFLSGTVYAIGGDLQKLGNGIFLCTPRNVPVEGKMTENDDNEFVDIKL
ncbi:MAG: cell division protein SepF [Bacilli bacterium]